MSYAETTVHGYILTYVDNKSLTLRNVIGNKQWVSPGRLDPIRLLLSTGVALDRARGGKPGTVLNFIQITMLLKIQASAVYLRVSSR